MSTLGEIQWTPYAKLKLAVTTALAEVKEKEGAITEELIQAVVGWLSDKTSDMAADARKFYEEEKDKTP